MGWSRHFFCSLDLQTDLISQITSVQLIHMSRICILFSDRFGVDAIGGDVQNLNNKKTASGKAVMHESNPRGSSRHLLVFSGLHSFKQLCFGAL